MDGITGVLKYKDTRDIKIVCRVGGREKKREKEKDGREGRREPRNIS
jgi:hypothetical protein